MLRLFAIAALLRLVTTPAAADTTAIYKSALGAEMIVEIAANGNMRASMGASGTYALTLDGEDYFVLFTDKGPVVDRFSDVAAVMIDYAQKLMREKNLPVPGDQPDFPALKFVQGGQRAIQGWPGTSWYMQMDKGRPAGEPDVVISADPDLAELGHAMARQFELSTTTLGQVMGHTNPMSGMLDLLRTGAPLQFAGMQLSSVNHMPIVAGRFTLPAMPETRDQVRARFVASGGHIP